MRTYLILFTASFLASLSLTPLVRRKATEWGAIASPDNGRHIHLRPTPRLGGIAIYSSFVLTLLLVSFIADFASAIFQASLPRLIALLAPATLIFLFGVYDDFRGTSAPVKILFQVIAAAMVYAGGLRIENLSSPFGGLWQLPLLLSFPLTALWIVLITNAFNLIDGIDGLAAGASVFALLSLLVFSFAQGNPMISLVSVALVGAVVGFLRYNFNPATIFLGDSGSLFLGFMAAALSLAGSHKGSTIVAIAIPLVSFGLPVIEVGLSLARRFLGGRPLFRGDRGHIHHMLLQRGLTQRQAVILLYAVCAVFSLFGLMLLNPKRDLGAFVFFILGVVIIFGVQHLRYAEFSELGSQIRQEVARRRRSLAVNSRIRHSTHDLSSARTIDQFFCALDQLLEPNEFDGAVLELQYDSFFEAQAYSAGGNAIVWSWGEAGLEEMLESDRFWSLRIPLTAEDGRRLGAITFYRCLFAVDPAIDINQICGSLPRELSAALVRLAGKEENKAAPGRPAARPRRRLSPASE